ncbi:PLDc N-terminal domain-containing protein [Modestobacter sp. SSW1-42]|uniref:PLDc N-terminal domain-containing protein n=1 Tax=Modestobacter sp. SSW1-42 TaxID=596372 RepID=UPI0039885655
MPVRRWAELSSRQQTAVLVAASVQLSLAATAWADLVTRPADQVNGSKGRWALVIAVNWIGPLAWFRWGRRTASPRRRAARPGRGRACGRRR